MTLKRDPSELSSRAKAFSVEALIGDKKSSEDAAAGSTSDRQPAQLPQQHQPQAPTQPAQPTPRRRGELRVELCSRDLWRRFHALGTEMIITKAGRRMFPTVKVRLSGLDPSATYIVFLDVVPLDDKRYRYVYHSSQWMVAGSGDPPLPHTVYVHPDSPATGQLWMAQGVVAFDKLKLTNNRRPLVRGQVSLHSMHKYLPRVHILETTDLETPAEQQACVERALTYTFPETAFTTVTAYQNQQITRLKIASNPFAKGFREASRTRDGSEDTRQLCRPLAGSGAMLPSMRPELFPLVHSVPPPPLFPLDPYCSSAALAPFFHRSFYPLTAPVRFVVPPQVGSSVADSSLRALCTSPGPDITGKMFTIPDNNKMEPPNGRKKSQDEEMAMDTSDKIFVQSYQLNGDVHENATYHKTVPLDLSKFK